MRDVFAVIRYQEAWARACRAWWDTGSKQHRFEMRYFALLYCDARGWKRPDYSKMADGTP